MPLIHSLKNLFALPLLGLTAAVAMSCCRPSASDLRVQASFARLDSTLNLHLEYGRAMEERLDNLRQKAAAAIDAEARYFYYGLLIDSYTFYEVDSALHYVQLCLDLARSQHHPEWETETLLAQARVCSSTGYMTDARDLLDEVSRRPMNEGLRMGYYIQQVYYWTQHAIYKDVWFEDPVRAYCDSILALHPAPDAPQALWARYYREEDPERKAEVCRDLKARLLTMPRSDAWYPRLCEAAGILSGVLGQEDDALVYLVDALCVDVSRVRRLLPTLSMVADMAYRRGETDYAFRFIRFFMGVRDDYADHLRNASLSTAPFRIYSSTLQQLERDTAMKSRFILALSIVLVLLVAFGVVNAWLLRRQVRLRGELAASHAQLEASLHQLQLRQEELRSAGAIMQENNRQLAATQQSLQEANFLKEEYIGQLFGLCSDYLERMGDLQKTVGRKLKAKQWDDLMKMAATAADSRQGADQRELNSHFDAIFLSIFPDFVEEFNGLLRPEERITLRRGERLNTELRIYALVRLGINNSVKIARILGVSSQTVYNARMKMRSLATESPLSLPERVRALGHWKAPGAAEDEADNQ